jgi:hypothetical protein
MLSFTIKSIILSVIMLSGVSFMLSIKIKCIMLSVTMLNVTMLYVVMLNALAALNYGRKNFCCAGPG